MLTRMRFQNWRSLKDVTIENLTPITVFIGANSSGKTNILDALYFIRSWITHGAQETVFAWQGSQQIQSVGTDATVKLEFDQYLNTSGTIHHHYSVDFKSKNLLPLTSGIVDVLSSTTLDYTPENTTELQQIANKVLRERIQLLDENFMPPFTRSATTAPDFYMIDECGDNLNAILDFMKATRPLLYQELQSDAAFILSHIAEVYVRRSEKENHLQIREALHPDIDAPTISSGTARVLAMLAAYYVLDMRDAELPGLVVIEEPDTALNPGLLERFVAQLRTYTEDNPNPRQFILTTHNPSFLNYFEPDEIRVVERGEDGYTTVNQIDTAISDIWLKDKDYGLGEVWMTHAFGGLPE